MIADPAKYLETRATDLLSDGFAHQKVITNQSFTFQGFPAREVMFTFVLDTIGVPVTHRYVIVARENRYYMFFWEWDDTGPMPADAQRINKSIKFIPMPP